MMVNTQPNLWRLMGWQQQNVQRFALAGFVVWLFNYFVPLAGLVPTLPLAVAGGAIGIFVSFRTNSSYDRWWEGRKLWGRLINTSRMWASQATLYIDDDKVSQELVHRQIAYVHVLRCVLRKQDIREDADVQKWLDEHEQQWLPTQSNPTHALLQRSLERCVALNQAGTLDSFRLQCFDESVKHLLDIQGGCERIKKTPIPMAYGYIVEMLVLYYSWLLPMALVDQVGIFVIPLSLVVCLAFIFISEVGRVLEDPFTLFYNGLPLYAMSRTIENNLRNRLGETDLEPVPVPDARGILM